MDVVYPREMTFAEGKALSEIPADQPNLDDGLGREIRQQDSGTLSVRLPRGRRVGMGFL